MLPEVSDGQLEGRRAEMYSEFRQISNMEIIAHLQQKKLEPLSTWKIILINLD